MSNRRGSGSSSGSGVSGCDACAQLSQLEIEAISAVREVAAFVRSICISEVLSRTPDLIFLNLTTLECKSLFFNSFFRFQAVSLILGSTYCIELTQRGWRVCSDREDCMNGDFRKLDFHSQYYETIYQLLDVVSPLYREQYAKAVAAKLNQLAATESLDPRDDNQPSNDA